MNDPVTIVVQGQPIGKARPRFTRRGDVYTPAATAVYEQQLAWAAKEEMRGAEPIQGPVRMYFRAIFAIPQSWSTAKRQQALLGIIRPTGKPDADNIQKVIADALNGIAYRDDSQITEMAGSKRYGEQPMVVVTVAPIVGSFTEQAVAEAKSLEEVA